LCVLGWNKTSDF
jgi:hypothetical protein